MRLIALIIAIPFVGCSDTSTAPGAGLRSTQSSSTQAKGASVKYDPRTFRADIARFISAGRFSNAVALVKVADIDRQGKFDGTGYLAVGEDMIVLPGVYPNVDYDPKRDWYMPGTQDAIQDRTWQAAATDFATRYNLRRAGKRG
jgi:hypothetical protein